MLSLLLVSALLATCGLASNVDDCVYGESHWCSSLENAKTCGAMEHCKSTVWQNQILKQDDTEVCSFCKTIVADVISLLQENKTQQEIMSFLQNVCQMIPEKAVASECELIVRTYTPEIIMLVTAVEPQVVCSLMKLCTGLEDHVRQPVKVNPEISAQNNLQLPLTKLIPLPVTSEPICTDCQKFFGDIKTMVFGNATEQEVEALIDQNLCARLGTYEDMCKQLVKQYLPEIMAVISSDFDPKLLCQAMGFCTQTLPEAKTFLIELKIKNSDFYKQMVKESSAEGCELCKLMVKDLQTLDRDSQVQTEIKNFFKTNLCPYFGQYKTGCEGFVDVYGQLLFEFLATELDPDSRCRSLGFCTASDRDENEIRDPVRESTPIGRSPSSASQVSDSPQCVLCEFVMKEIDSLIANNKTEQNIIAALEKVCDMLPSSIKAPCDDFIKTYGKAILDLLLQELDPKAICTVLGLCSSSEKPTPPAADSAYTCMVCETIVQYLEALMEENATIEVIDSYLQKICNFLPDTMKTECNDVVNTYGPRIINYISMKFTPKQVCEMAKVCPSGADVKKQSVPLLGANECSWGPKYWCASRENARACKTTAYCEINGWNF